MSQTPPLVDPHTASYISTFAIWLWPVLVTGVVAAAQWRRLGPRLGFLVLGYLTCLGVGALFAKFGFMVYFIHFAPKTPEDRLVATLVNTSLTITLFGAVLSVAPVLWLAKLLTEPRVRAAS